MNLKVAWTTYKDNTKNAKCKYSRPNAKVGGVLLNLDGNLLVNPPSFSEEHGRLHVRLRRAIVFDLGRSTREAVFFEQAPTMVL